jgi:WD40 repeat protein
MDGTTPRRLPQPDKAVRALALSPDGKVVAAGGEGAIRLWDVATGKKLRELPGHPGTRITCLAFWPARPGLLASAGLDGGARLWETGSGKELHRFRHKGVNGLAFSPNGKALAAGGYPSEEGTVLWDLATKKEIRRFPSGPLYVGPNTLAFSPDGRYLAASGRANAVQVWEAATGKPLDADDLSLTGLSGLALAPDGKTAAVAAQHLDVTLWELATGKVRARLPRDGTGGVVAGFTPEGRLLLGRPRDFESELAWRDLTAGKDVRSLRLPFSMTAHFALAPGGSKLAILANDCRARVWDLAAGKELFAVKDDGLSSYALAFSADGMRLATAGAVWGAATGKAVRRLRPGHGTTVAAVAFSPDGKAVATACHYKVLLWSAEGDAPPRELCQEGGTALAFAPGGRLLAVGGQRGVSLWDVAAGRRLRQWVGHRGPVQRLAFTAGGSHLVSASSDGTALVWGVAP